LSGIAAVCLPIVTSNRSNNSAPLPNDRQLEPDGEQPRRVQLLPNAEIVAIRDGLDDQGYG